MVEEAPLANGRTSGRSPSGHAADGLHERAQAGRAAWPHIDVPEAMFAAYVGQRTTAATPLPLERAADLWLACGCTFGVPGAADALIATYRGLVQRAVARVDSTIVDEATQRVFVSLLVREGDDPPRIAEYGGRAALSTWIATVAARTALKARRRKDDQSHESLDGLTCAIAAEPELVLAKARYGPEVQAALRRALAALDARQLLLLQLHHGKGWSVDRLGSFYRVGRSTAARWVASARGALLDKTKRDLQQRLRLEPRELESLLTLLKTQLGVTLVSLLNAEG
jgi:RNA polymerase sigma-70 factor (ECF subfamily)